MCGSSKKTRKKAKCVEPQKIFSKCVEAQFAVKINHFYFLFLNSIMYSRFEMRGIESIELPPSCVHYFYTLVLCTEPYPR